MQGEPSCWRPGWWWSWWYWGWRWPRGRGHRVGRKILVVATAKIVVFWSRDC
jgi:hypothetical protein